jgi:hypothetical protein
MSDQHLPFDLSIVSSQFDLDLTSANMPIQILSDIDLAVDGVEPARFVLLGEFDTDALTGTPTVVASGALIAVASVAVETVAFTYRNSSRSVSANKAVSCILTGLSAGIETLTITATTDNSRTIVRKVRIEVVA